MFLVLRSSICHRVIYHGGNGSGDDDVGGDGGGDADGGGDNGDYSDGGDDDDGEVSTGTSF
jgi:hypothetical protein